MSGLTFTSANDPHITSPLGSFRETSPSLESIHELEEKGPVIYIF